MIKTSIKKFKHMNYIFLFLMLGLYAGLHFLLYLATVALFSISTLKFKLIILGIYGLLALSFFGTMILSHYSDNPLTRVLYLISALWIGMLIFLVIAFTLAWIISIFIKNPANLKLFLGIGALVVSDILLIIGYYQATHPAITRLDIGIANLPENWNNKKIVQLSDIHLGRIHGKAFLNEVITRVNKLQPDIVFITGDLFDGLGDHVENFIADFHQMQAPLGIYFVTGNHESYLGVDKVLALLEKTPIVVLNNELKEIDGLQIIGLSFVDFAGEQDKNILTTIPGFDAEKANILLYHEPIALGRGKNMNGNGHSELYFGPKTDFTVQENNGIDLQLSGHTHAGQFFPFTLLTKMIYKNYHAGLHQIGNFQLYVSGGTGTWGPPLRLGTRGEIVLIQLHQK